MTFYFENEVEASFDFDCEEILAQVIQCVLELEKCPYEVQVNVLLTDLNGIWEFNRTYRQVDNPTDVLSFPNISFEAVSDFSIVEKSSEDYFDPDSGELILGDIILCADKIKEQALDFGHSFQRELAYLTVHSFLHLMGYDHMEDEEKAEMRALEKEIMKKLGIFKNEVDINE